MNTVILSGNISQKFDNGNNVKISIADTYKDKTVFIPITLYEHNAEFARKYLEPGDHISIEGRISMYENAEGKKGISIIAHRVNFEGYKNPHKGDTSYRYTKPAPQSEAVEVYLDSMSAVFDDKL